MAQYEVTGVRYQMGDELTLEEKTLRAEEFVRALQDGTQLILAAEPDNPKDIEAIAVYKDYTRRVGYIKHECCKEVKPLLNEEGLCTAVVCGNDGHVTFYIDIPEAPEASATMKQAERVLPPCPLPQGVRLAFSKEEQGLQVVASMLVKKEVNADTAGEVLDMMERYMPLSRLSFCYEDDFWRDRVLWMLRKACRLKLPQEQKERFEQLQKELKSTMGDFHRVHEQWQWKVFEAQLAKAKSQAKAADGLFERFEAYAKPLDGGISEALEELQDWFARMPHVKLRNPKDHHQLAETLNYQRVSRQELYEVYAALLLLEQHQDQLIDERLEELSAKLLPMFYNDAREVRKFLIDALGMTPMQITEKVNELVRRRKISDMSKRRPLWKALSEYNIYDKSESNWNQQVE